MKASELKPGTPLVIMARVVRPVVHREPVEMDSGKVEPVNNLRDNKFWAEIHGSKKKVMCFCDGDGLPDAFQAALILLRRSPRLIRRLLG